MGNTEMRFMRGKELGENLMAFSSMVSVALDLLGPPLIVIAAVFVDIIKVHPGLEQMVRDMLDGKDVEAVLRETAVRMPKGTSPAAPAEG